MMNHDSEPKSLIDFHRERFRPSADLISSEAVDELRFVLEKPGTKRTNEDLHQADGVAILLKFFQNLKNRSQRLSILRVATFRRFEENTVVFSQGELGDFFYIILRGKAAVIKNEAYYEREVQVATLFSGMGFGELALHSDSGLRSATIATLTDCEFLVVDRAGYQSVVREWAVEKLEMRARFLKTVYFFSHWSRPKLENLAKLLINKCFPPGAVIVREGTFAEEMFLIKKGEVKLIKLANLRGQRLMLDIGVLGAGDYFGEVAMMAEKPRACSVVAVGNVEVLLVNRYDFEEHVSTDARAVASINIFAKEHYKSEAALLKTFQRCYLWQTYKLGMVENIVGPERAQARHVEGTKPPARSSLNRNVRRSPRQSRMKRERAAARVSVNPPGVTNSQDDNNILAQRNLPIAELNKRRLGCALVRTSSMRSAVGGSQQHVSRGAVEQRLCVGNLPRLPSVGG